MSIDNSYFLSCSSLENQDEVLKMGVTVTDSNANCISLAHEKCSENEFELKGETSCLDEEEEEPLDPRIQTELEMMNKATDLINKFENDLVMAQKKFKILFADSCDKLDAASKKLGAYIHRAIPYYDCRLKAKAAQDVVHEATSKYEAAVSMETTAREMQEVAEQYFDKEKSKHNLSWQEMLNHATNKLLEAEEATRLCQGEQLRAERTLEEVERDVQRQYKRNKRAIAKSKPYYEKKAKFHTLLEQQREVIALAESNFSGAKALYAKSMSNLEAISNEIHVRRQNSGQSTGTQSSSSKSDLSETDGNVTDTSFTCSETSSNEMLTATFTIGRTSSNELITDSEKISSTELNLENGDHQQAYFYDTEETSTDENDEDISSSPILKKRSASFIDPPVCLEDVPIITKSRSMSFPSSFVDADAYDPDNLDSSSGLNRSDSSILDDQCIQGALSHLYFDTDCNCPRKLSCSRVTSICSTLPEHDDYDTLPDNLSQYQKQFTLKRSASRRGSQDIGQLSLNILCLTDAQTECRI